MPSLSTLSGTVKVGINATGTLSAAGSDYSPLRQTVSFTKVMGPYTTANANNASFGANECTSAIYTIASGAGLDINLQNITDILNQAAVSFVRVKAYIFRLLSAADDSVNGTACSGVIINSPVPAPTMSAPVVSGSGGSLAAGTYYYIVTATTAAGESLLQVTGTNNQVSATTTGSTSQVTLSWARVTDATGYKIYRSTTSQSYGASSLLTTISSGSTVTYTDTGSATTSGTPPTNTTFVTNGGLVANLQTFNGIVNTVLNNGDVMGYGTPSASGWTVSGTANTVHFQNLDTANAGALEISFIGGTT